MTPCCAIVVHSWWPSCASPPRCHDTAWPCTRGKIVPLSDIPSRQLRTGVVWNLRTHRMVFRHKTGCVSNEYVWIFSWIRTIGCQEYACIEWSTNQPPWISRTQNLECECVCTVELSNNQSPVIICTSIVIVNVLKMFRPRNIWWRVLWQEDAQFLRALPIGVGRLVLHAMKAKNATYLTERFCSLKQRPNPGMQLKKTIEEGREQSRCTRRHAWFQLFTPRFICLSEWIAVWMARQRTYSTAWTTTSYTPYQVISNKTWPCWFFFWLSCSGQLEQLPPFPHLVFACRTNSHYWNWQPNQSNCLFPGTHLSKRFAYIHIEWPMSSTLQMRTSITNCTTWRNAVWMQPMLDAPSPSRPWLRHAYLPPL